MTSFKSIKKQAGFSLMELMITVSIIAVLGSIAVPTYQKQRTKARRGDCKSMLSALSIAQTSYISDESMSYRDIHCPKTSASGLHTRSVPAGGGATAPQKNVIVIPLSERDTYCNNVGNLGPENVEGGVVVSTYDGSIDTKIAYQYRFKACPSNSLVCGAIADGTVFPALATANNVYGFTNTTVPALPLATASAGLLNPTLPYQFLLQCAGNIDEDTTPDIINMDHTGATVQTSDDVKN